MAAAFDTKKAARDLERAGLDPSAAAAIARAGATRRGALDAVPAWLAALLLGTFIALLGWGALEIKDTGERLTLVEYKVDELEKKVSKLEEGQRKLIAMLQIVLDRLPPPP